MTTLTNRAAVVERLLTELGDPPIVTVLLYENLTTVHLATPHPDVEWTESDSEHGHHWRASIVREDLPIVLCAFREGAAA